MSVEPHTLSGWFVPLSKVTQSVAWAERPPQTPGSCTGGMVSFLARHNPLVCTNVLRAIPPIRVYWESGALVCCPDRTFFPGRESVMPALWTKVRQVRYYID